MSDRFRKGLAIVLALALALTVFGIGGCQPDEDDGTGEEPTGDVQKGGTFAYYITEPAFIDPYNAQESEGTQVVQAVFDSLVTFDPLTLEILPAAAESWEANADATVWTFTLVEGATFHNGDPVTAADFKYAWERIANPDNASEISYHLAPIKGFDEMQAGEATELSGVVAVDERTLEVTLNYPYGDFEYVVGHPGLAPVPQAAVEADAEGFAEMPIGNGPFKLAEPWAHNQYIKVVKNEDYYGDEPNIDGVDFKIFQDEDTAFLEFEAGNLDFTHIPSGQIAQVIEQYGESEDGFTISEGKQAVTGLEMAVYYYAINTKKAPFDDPKVRQALSYACPRQKIIDTLFDGIRQPADGMVPPNLAAYEAGAWPASVDDMEMAAQLLEEAGYPGGEGFPAFTIAVNSGVGHEDIAQIFLDNLTQLGLEVTLEPREWAQHIDALQNGEYDIARFGWIADYPTADNFLYSLFITDGSDNITFYSNPDVDAALTEARQETDEDARIAQYKEINKMIGADQPVIPVMYYSHIHVGSDRIRDGIYNAQGLFNFESVWLAQ